MRKYVVDAGVVLHLLEIGLDPSSDVKLLAPTLIRSEVLESLYKGVRSGEISEKEGRERLERFATLKIRYLGDRVLRSVAWKLAAELGWDTTNRAEYIALTQLQADAFITLDKNLARSVSELVEVAPLDVLR